MKTIRQKSEALRWEACAYVQHRMNESPTTTTQSAGEALQHRWDTCLDTLSTVLMEILLPLPWLVQTHPHW